MSAVPNGRSSAPVTTSVRSSARSAASSSTSNWPGAACAAPLSTADASSVWVDAYVPVLAGGVPVGPTRFAFRRSAFDGACWADEATGGTEGMGWAATRGSLTGGARSAVVVMCRSSSSTRRCRSAMRASRSSSLRSNCSIVGRGLEAACPLRGSATTSPTIAKHAATAAPGFGQREGLGGVIGVLSGGGGWLTATSRNHWRAGRGDWGA